MPRREVQHLPEQRSVALPRNDEPRARLDDEEREGEIGGQHALGCGDQHVRGNHPAHDVLLVHHLHARVWVARGVVGVVADGREGLPACAAVVQHALHVLEVPHEALEHALRAAQVHGTLPHEQVAHVRQRPVEQRVAVLRGRQARVRHIVGDQLDQRDGVRQPHVVRQRHHRRREDAGDLDRLRVDQRALLAQLRQQVAEVRGGERDRLLRERVPEDARGDEDLLRVVVAHLVPLAQALAALLQERQQPQPAREVRELRRGDGRDEPHDRAAQPPLPRVHALHELRLQVLAEVQQRARQLRHHGLRRALAVLQVVDAVGALTVPLGVVVAAQVQV